MHSFYHGKSESTLLALFRRNVFFTQLLLLPYIFLIRAITLIEPKAFLLPEKSNVFQKSIFLTIQQPFAQNVIANILIFIQAMIVNSLVVKHRLSRENTLIPAVIYVLFATIMPENALLSPVIVANTFVILALYHIFTTYKVQIATVNIFNAGLFLALASLFYAPYFTFLLFGIIALSQLRAFRLMEFIQYAAGFVTPFFLLFTYRYCNDIVFFDSEFLLSILGNLPKSDKHLVLSQWVGFSVLLVATLFLLGVYGTITGRKNIQIQKKFDIVYWLMFFCLTSFFAFQSNQLEHLLTLTIPISILAGNMASDSTSRVFYEFVHLLLLASIVLTHFVLS
jgi:hypothetical protein